MENSWHIPEPGTPAHDVQTIVRTIFWGLVTYLGFACFIVILSAA